MEGKLEQNQSPEVPRPKSTASNAMLPFLAVMLLLAVLSAFVAFIPHLAAYAQYKSFRFYSNFDDQIYNAIAKTAYLDGWHLREPYTRPEEGVPSLYAPLLFLPYSTVTRLLQLHSVDILAVMRVLGGLLLGVTLTFCLYRFLEGTRHRLFWVALCGIIFLCDTGTLGGRTFISNFVEIGYIFKQGWPPLGDFLGQFRVAAVLLCLPFLLLLVMSLAETDSPPKRDIFLGIGAFVALIYTYFYYWVAAAALLAVLIAWGIVKSLRAGRGPLSRSVLSLTAVLVAGLILGSPQIFQNARTAAQPQFKNTLARIARGQTLQPGDPIRFILVRNFWVWGKLLLAAFVIRMLRLWRLKVLWILSAIGYLLTNLAVALNIDFENHHWITVTYPISEVLMLVLFAYCAERYLNWRWLRWAAPCFALAIAIPGVTLRGMATLRADFGKNRTAALQRALPLEKQSSSLGPDCTIVGSSDEAEAVFQMSPCAMLFSTPYTALITPIPDQEVHERQALTYWLEGWTLDAYRAVAGYPMAWNSFGHPEWQPPFLVQARTDIFRKLSDAAFRRQLIARYKPTHLVINERSGLNPARDCEWKTLDSVNGVTIYELIKP